MPSFRRRWQHYAFWPSSFSRPFRHQSRPEAGPPRDALDASSFRFNFADVLAGAISCAAPFLVDISSVITACLHGGSLQLQFNLLPLVSVRTCQYLYQPLYGAVPCSSSIILLAISIQPASASFYFIIFCQANSMQHSPLSSYAPSTDLYLQTCVAATVIVCSCNPLKSQTWWRHSLEFQTCSILRSNNHSSRLVDLQIFQLYLQPWQYQL